MWWNFLEQFAIDTNLMLKIKIETHCGSRQQTDHRLIFFLFKLPLAEGSTTTCHNGHISYC